MILTTPRMGTMQLMLEDMFKRIGSTYQAPPPTTQRTIEIGVRNSPEFACLPLKVCIGNFIEAIEEGADTIVMAGGCGPCRFGYYAQVQAEVLKGMGHDVDWIVLESPKKIVQFVRTFRKMAPDKSIPFIWKQVKISFTKAVIYDELERMLLKLRAYEPTTGAAEQAYREAIEILRPADSPEDIQEAGKKAVAHFETAVPVDPDKPVLRVGIVGEFYMLLDPTCNLEIEKWLGERGVSLERSMYTTDWLAPGANAESKGMSKADVKTLSYPYLKHSVGGEGQQTIAHTVHYSQLGFDGVVHLMPFTCMPETIAKTVLPTVCSDLKMPYMTFVVDEQTGKAGVVTRLEALLDLMWARRATRDGVDAVPVGAGM